MFGKVDLVEGIIETIATDIVAMDGEDIPLLRSILKRLNELKKEGKSLGHTVFSSLLSGLQIYIEKIILRETDNIKPLEKGVNALQSVHRCIRDQVSFKEDISNLLIELGLEFKADNGVQDSATVLCQNFGKNEAASSTPNDTKTEDGIEVCPSIAHLNEEDLDLITSFVMESQESLEAVEVSLIDLEQAPDDAENINTIFRAFHTIKGVSGFLNFFNINKLAHYAENLLESIRSGDIIIDQPVVDIILASVDILKQLIQGVADGIQNNSSLDVGIDINPLIQRIEEVAVNGNRFTFKPIGTILVQRGDLTSELLQKGLEKQYLEPDKKLGQILIDEKSVTPAQVEAALNDQKKTLRSHLISQVKVDTQKLDNLMDLTGELVIAQTMLKQYFAALAVKDQKLNHNLGRLNQITSSLQATAMSMRMVPIKATFQRMLRLVRNLSQTTGKKVRLVMNGEETQIDRNVVEELYEPMVHMIRNSVDHGIEMPEDRLSAGKDPAGQISLKACHKGGNIIVEICDDGRGLDKCGIIRRAKACGLITDEESLSDRELFNLIFHPGFSTAKKVSDISGRGVGMDVVKKTIETLKGRIEVRSRPGKGSTFIISLPLTLAILDGIIVRVGPERYVIPALSVVESFRPAENDYSTFKDRGEMILFRGKLIRLVRLNRIFNLKCSDVDPWKALVVVAEYENHQIALLLDELLGKEEVVIKSLGDVFKAVNGITGGAILGDGRVGLILDIAGIWKILSN